MRSITEDDLRRALRQPRAPVRPLLEPLPRPAAVVLPVVFGPDGARVIAVVRAEGLREHGGEVAFPGGKPDPADADLRATALRELTEEVGVAAGDIEVLGELTPMTVINRAYVIHSFVGIASREARFRCASTEAGEVVTLPLEAFLAGERPFGAVRATWRNEPEFLAPHFDIPTADRIDGAMPGPPRRRVLYGASAYIFHELLTLIAHAMDIALPEPRLETELPWGDRYSR